MVSRVASWAEHTIWWQVYPLGFTGDDSFRFPVEVAGLTLAQTPDPGARPDDPALVPAHSWAILSP